MAGLAYALNGLTFNCVMWTSNLAALSWLPLVMLCVERAWREGGRRIVPAVFVGALQMLSGAPEIILLTWFLVGTLWLGQAWGKSTPLAASASRLALIVALISALAAVQLLPVFELLQQSDRDPGRGNGAWAMPSWGWANLLVPLFRCSRSILGPYFQVEQQWTSSYYLGIGVVALATVAVWKAGTLRVWWLAFAALFGLGLALGENGVLHRLVKPIFPALELARYPIKFVVPTVFAFPMLAAFGAKWAQGGKGEAAEKTTREPLSLALSPPRGEGSGADSTLGRALLWPGVVLLTLVGAIVAVARFFPYPGEFWPVTLRNGLERAMFLVSILGAFFLLAHAGSVGHRRWLGLGVLLLLGLDALAHAPRQNPTVSNRAYGRLELGMSLPAAYPDSHLPSVADAASGRPTLGQSRAMVSPQMQALLARMAMPDPLVYYTGNRRSLFEDCNLIEGIAKVNGFFSLRVRELSAVQALLYNPTNFPAGLVDFLGVTQISAPDVFWKWVPRSTSLPLATAGQQAIFADRAETLKALASPAFKSGQFAYLPLEARYVLAATNAATARITWSEFSAQRISLGVEAAQPALVVVAQTYYPAWRAYVDHRPARLWRANYAFQAVEVPAGRHEVLLVYRDRCFYAGAAISVIALAGCILFQFRCLRRAARH